MPAGIRGDVGGRVPFSLVAVVALLLSGMSATYVATTSQEAARADLQLQEIRSLRAIAESVHKALELEVHALALRAIDEAAEGPTDTDRTNEAFVRLVDERVRPRFPLAVRGYTVELADLRVAMFLQAMRAMDAAPVPGRTFDPARPAELRETSRPVYFGIAGHAEYVVRGPAGTYAASLPFHTTVDSPFPLVRSAAREFRGATAGPSSELARLIRYALTTAAQFRAIQGYAAPAFGEVGTTTFDVLTREDVELAVNLALLLEELRRFRAVDAQSPAAIDDTYYAAMAGRYLGGGLWPDAAERTIGRLLASYARGGTADIADLFALYGAFDARPVLLNRVLAQAVSAILDQETLEILDYFGIGWLVDTSLPAGELLVRDLEGFLTYAIAGAHEADIIRSFLRDVFTMAGEAASLLGPTALPLPHLAYNVTNGDGARYEVSVSAHDAPVEFGRVDLLQGHDEMWREFFAAVFADDLRAAHRSVREFVLDFATRVADGLNDMGLIANPSLRGAIDPKDEEGVLDIMRTQLDEAVGDALARLRDDPSYIDSMISGLWRAHEETLRHAFDMIVERYDALVSGYEQVSGAEDRLEVHILNQAMADQDYWSLDSEGVADLRGAIAADVFTKAWVPLTYFAVRGFDEAKLGRVYAVATDAATPPERGGIYAILRGHVLGATGVLASAGDAMRTYADELLRAADLHNLKLLLAVPEPPFEFWFGDREAAEAAGAIRREAFALRQTPAVLQTTRYGGYELWDLDGVDVGDLWVDIRDPSEVPAGPESPNVHWTRPGEDSLRPFETRWDVRIAAALRVDVMSDRGVRLGVDGHVPEIATETIRLELRIPVTVYSGWPLTGVDYTSSDTFSDEVWERVSPVLDTLWRTVLEPVLGILMDYIEAYVDTLLQMLRRALTPELVQALSDSISTIVERLQATALEALAPARASIEDLIVRVSSGNISFTVNGFGLSIGLGPRPPSLQVSAWKEGFDGAIVFVVRGRGPPEGTPTNLSNAPVDILVRARVYADGLTLEVEGDALTVVEGRLFTARGIPEGGGWALEFTVPSIDTARLENAWEGTLPPVPTPLGPLTLSAGIDIRYSVTTKVDWLKVIGGAFSTALDSVGGFPKSQDDLVRFFDAFLEKLIKNIVELLLLGRINLREVLFYVDGVFGAANAAGIGFRIGFVIDGELLVKVLRWVMDAISEFLRTFPEPPGTADYGALETYLADHTGVRFEAYTTVGLPRFLGRALPEEVPTRLRMYARVQPNVAALLNGWRPDVGHWRVDFGAYLEAVPSGIADALFGTKSATPDVWLVRGAVYEVPAP